MATTTTNMTYASSPHPPTGFPVNLDDAMGPHSPTSSAVIDKHATPGGTGIEDEAAAGLKGLIATGSGAGRSDLGIEIGGHFLLSPSSPVKERSRRATMPEGFKSRTHEVLIPSRLL